MDVDASPSSDRGFGELYSEENRDSIIGGLGQARNGAALPEANDAVEIRGGGDGCILLR